MNDSKYSTGCSKCGQPFIGGQPIIGHETATWHEHCPTPNPVSSNAEDSELEAMRKQLEKSGFYAQLVDLHKSRHHATNCFCTTEIAPAYGALLAYVGDYIAARDIAQRQAYIEHRKNELYLAMLTIEEFGGSSPEMTEVIVRLAQRMQDLKGKELSSDTGVGTTLQQLKAPDEGKDK